MGNRDDRPENNTRTRRTYSIGIKEEKEIKKEKTLLQKVTSFLASTYYNISKVIILSITIVGFGVLITNYNVFPILEKIFLIEEGSAVSKDSLIEIKGLNLNNDFVTEEEFKTVYNRLSNELSVIYRGLKGWYR